TCRLTCGRTWATPSASRPAEALAKLGQDLAAEEPQARFRVKPERRAKLDPRHPCVQQVSNLSRDRFRRAGECKSVEKLVRNHGGALIECRVEGSNHVVVHRDRRTGALPRRASV